MVRETTVKVEKTIKADKDVVVADRCEEDIHFDGETVAIKGEFNDDGETADSSTFHSALMAIGDGVERVDVNEHISIINKEDRGGRRRIRVTHNEGKRETDVEELQEAHYQSLRL